MDENARNAVTMDSETYGRSPVERMRSGGAVRQRVAAAHRPAPLGAEEDIAMRRSAADRVRAMANDGATSGRLRAAALIVIAVVALSAIAATGWMQYQSRTHTDDPQIEIAAPDASVPALADSAAR